MEARKKIIISLAVASIVLIAIILFLIFRPKQEVTIVNPSPSTSTVATELTKKIESLPPPTPEKVKEENSYPLGLKQLAFAFAERFGSYSNDGKYKNLTDLEPLMTEKMKQSSKSIITSVVDNNDYQGVSTVALSSELKSFNTNSAEIIVKTQRSQSIGQAAPSLSYQDLDLKMVKVGEEWKIDEASWK